jgi:hypothetical protein
MWLIAGEVGSLVLGLLIVVAMNIYWDKQWEKRTGLKLPRLRDRFRKKKNE